MYLKPLDTNVLFITLDSCRYDTFVEASTPTIDSLGSTRCALTHATYTVPAHVAFFTGHLPVVLDSPQPEYYSEASRQLWRIATGPIGDADRAWLVLNGNNILEGYRKLGF